MGEFSVGSEFDAVWLRPVEGSTLDCGLRNADSADAALAKVFALGTDADVAGVWIGGVPGQRLSHRDIAVAARGSRQLAVTSRAVARSVIG